MGQVLSRLRHGPYMDLDELKTKPESQFDSVQLAKLVGVSVLGWQLVDYLGGVLLSGTGAWARATPQERHRFGTYFASLVHAVGVTAFASYKVLFREPANIRGTRSLVAVSVGYFISDLIATRRDWMTHPVDLGHHIAAIVVAGGAMFAWQIAEFIPRFFLVESSTICLDIMWMLKTFSGSNNSLYRLTATLFALLFFIKRVVMLPAFVLDIQRNHSQKWVSMGPGRFMFYPICGLQFYWFYRIVSLLRRTVVKA